MSEQYSKHFENGLVGEQSSVVKDEKVKWWNNEVNDIKIVSVAGNAEQPRPRNILSELNTSCNDFFQNWSSTTVTDGHQSELLPGCQYGLYENNVPCQRNETITIKENEVPPRNKILTGQNIYCRDIFQGNSQSVVPAHHNVGIVPNCSSAVPENYSFSNKEFLIGNVGMQPSLNRAMLTGLNSYFNNFQGSSLTTIPVHHNVGFAPNFRNTASRNISMSRTGMAPGINSNGHDFLREGFSVMAPGYYNNRFASQSSVLDNISIARKENTTKNRNGEPFRNIKVLSTLNTHCNDFFREGCSTMIPKPSTTSVAFNLPYTGSENNISIANEGNVENGGPYRNRNILSKRNTYCNDIFQKSSPMTFAVPNSFGVSHYSPCNVSGNNISIARNGANPESGEPLVNQEVHPGHTYFKDFFQENSTAIAAVPHYRDLTCNSQSDVSKNEDSQSRCADVNNIDPFLCKICQISFSLFDGLENHLRCSHAASDSTKPFCCRMCSSEFKFLEELKSHFYHDHTPEMNAVCRKCGVQFSSPRSSFTCGMTEPLELDCGRCLKKQHESTSINIGVDEKVNSNDVISRAVPKSTFEKETMQRLEITNNLDKQNMNYCRVCQKQFMYAGDLKRHIRRFHTVYKLYGCEVCGKKFASEPFLTVHTAKCKRNNNNLTCSIPPKEQRDSVSLSENGSNSIDEEPCTCGKCGKPFLSLMELKEHSCSRVWKYRCEICEKTFYRKSNLLNHRLIHTGEKPFSCEICNRKYRCRRSLANHRCKNNNEINSGAIVSEGHEKNELCDESPKMGDKELFIVSEINSTCGNCGTKFSFPHCTFPQESTKLTELLCSSCLKQPGLATENMKSLSKKTDVDMVTRARELIREKISAGKETGAGWDAKNPIVERNIDNCKVCRNGFTSMVVLKRHIKLSHSHQGFYGCESCGKKFASETNLSAHIAVCRNRSSILSKAEPERASVSEDHPEELDQGICTCEKCGKMYLSEEKLAKHSCTRILKHRCEICEKAFSTKRKLRSHSRLHTGEKPFSCGTCGNKYRFKRSLGKHQCRSRNKKESNAVFSEERADSELCGKSLKEEPCSCEKCGKLFLTKGKLARHSCTRTLKHRCEVCEKAFSSKSKLSSHSRAHAGEKPFSCDVCCKKYRFRKSLNNHHCRKSRENDVSDYLSLEHSENGTLDNEAEHISEKPCTCDVCGREYLNERKLARHSSTHILNHRCDICEKVFSSGTKLRIHRRHVGERNLSCDKCAQKYCSKKSLKNHQCKGSSNVESASGNVSEQNAKSELHDGVPNQTEKEQPACEKRDEKLSKDADQNNGFRSGIRKHGCGTCEKVFSSWCELRNHRFEHTGEEPYSCDICGQKYRLGSSLRKHYYLRHGDEKDLCGVCPKQSTDGALCEHRARLTDRKRLACEKCGKRYPSVKSLARHSATHFLCCDICKRTFSTATRLREHRHLHTGEKPFSCDTCGKKFGRMCLLKQHYLIHTPRDENTPSESSTLHRCEICDRAHLSMSALRTHLLAHTGEKPHGCHLCERKFRGRYSLNVHLRKHSNVKYFCDICGKGFQSRYYLRMCHVLTHSGEKPHSCVACDKTFLSRQQLRNHFRIHSGEKPYECETCWKRFTSSGDLKKHVRVHTGEKPYVCDVCERGFTQKWVMVAHRRIHTGERPFECEVCQRGFIYKSQLKTHLLSHSKRKSRK